MSQMNYKNLLYLRRRHDACLPRVEFRIFRHDDDARCVILMSFTTGAAKCNYLEFVDEFDKFCCRDRERKIDYETDLDRNHR